LYLSTFLKSNRAEYYDRLTAIREHGDWEGWLRYFLRGVAETAEGAAATARSIVQLRETHRSLIQEEGLGMHGLRLLDLLFHSPVVNVRFVQRRLDIAYVTANKMLSRLESLGIVEETTGGERSRRFRYSPYMRLFESQDTVADPQSRIQTTEAAT
jgi:Fic family protein